MLGNRPQLGSDYGPISLLPDTTYSFAVLMNSIPILPPICQFGKTSPSARTILVVEDFWPLSDLVVRHLSSCGYHVLAACDTLEARRSVTSARGQIDVVLIDLNVPGLRGDELAAWFTEEYPRTRIILMSHHAVSLPDIHGSGFLQKPFALTDLAVAVRAALAAPVVHAVAVHRGSMAA